MLVFGRQFFQSPKQFPFSCLTNQECDEVISSFRWLSQEENIELADCAQLTLKFI